MSLLDFEGFLLFSISLVLLIFAQKLLQREIQILLLLLTGNTNLSIGIFSILVFPGVFIHELSHFLLAILLKVPVLKISLIPEVSKKGKIRLGFVQTAKSDVIRDSLIGLAPFIVGLLLLAIIGKTLFGIEDLASQSIIQFGQILIQQTRNLPTVPDFGIWIYIAFAISTTMIPSESDRQSWNLILFVIGLVLVIVFISGLGSWMMTRVYPTLNNGLVSLGFIISGSLVIHMLFFIPVWIFRLIIQTLTGYRVAK